MSKIQVKNYVTRKIEACANALLALRCSRQRKVFIALKN